MSFFAPFPTKYAVVACNHQLTRRPSASLDARCKSRPILGNLEPEARVGQRPVPVLPEIKLVVGVFTTPRRETSAGTPISPLFSRASLVLIQFLVDAVSVVRGSEHEQLITLSDRRHARQTSTVTSELGSHSTSSALSTSSHWTLSCLYYCLGMACNELKKLPTIKRGTLLTCHARHFPLVQ